MKLIQRNIKNFHVKSRKHGENEFKNTGLKKRNYKLHKRKKYM